MSEERVRVSRGFFNFSELRIEKRLNKAFNLISIIILILQLTRIPKIRRLGKLHETIC